MKENRGFRPLNRLKRNFEFKRVRDKGASYRGGFFILTIRGNDVDNPRLGLSISPYKVPLATKRNRLKRLIREVFRVNRPRYKNRSYDMVISLAKSPPNDFDYKETEKQLLYLMKKAGAL